MQRTIGPQARAVLEAELQQRVVGPGLVAAPKPPPTWRGAGDAGDAVV